MAKKSIEKSIEDNIIKSQTFNPLLNALRENDKKNLFQTNVNTMFHKTGFHLFDYYFGSVINIHNDLGEIIKQEPRVGQAAGTFNLIIGNTASGKAQPLSTRIPLPNGHTYMGNLTIGDQIIGSAGNLITVTGIFDRGLMDTYKLVFNDGRISYCSADHLWNINTGTENTYYTIPLTEIMTLYKSYKLFIPPSPGSTISPYITNIENVGMDNVRCISVDAEDGLYVTENDLVTHNTTLAVQLSANIIRQYSHSSVIHYDCEQRFDTSRAENISRLPANYFESGRYIIKSGAIGLDTMQESIVKLYTTKMKMKDELSISTGLKNEFGKEITILEPTMIVIDSITSVLTETFSPDNTKDVSNAEKLRSNTEGARDAKGLKGFFKDILPLCKEANIIIYAINHINTNMSMNAFVPVSKQHNFLKQDESIPGGKTMLYYPFNIIKLIARPSDDFTEDTDGFSGHIVMVEPIKSSSNQSGNNSKGISFEMIFSFKYGFDSLRSIIWYGKEMGIIEGNKNRMKFKDDPSFTFSFKDINRESQEKPIWESIRKYIIPLLENHLSFIEPSEVKFDNRMMEY
jgi:hypothetical protein